MHFYLHWWRSGRGYLQDREGCLKAHTDGSRDELGRVVGLGAGRTMKWGRLAISRYAQAGTGKGDLGIWRRRLGRGDSLYHLGRGGEVETGDHLVL